MLNDINIFSLARRINRPLILDGAMGSLLQQKGIKTKGSMWMSLANLEHPEIVMRIHHKYITAGADIITTNTFRTNPIAVDSYGKLNIKHLVKESVKIAKEASKGLPVFVAGSNPPAEDCYQVPRKISRKQIELNHHNHIDLLIENGVHFILNETQSHFDEILIICKHCSKNNIPYVISLFVDEKLNLLSGENILNVIPQVIEYEPMAIGINCVFPNTYLKFHRNNKFNFNWGAYLNCGEGSHTDENIKCGITPNNYGNYIKKILKKSPSFVGACCGSTPLHIKEIKRILDEKPRN